MTSRRSMGLRLGMAAATTVGLGYGTMFHPVSQVFGPFPHRAETADKVVALTFDDGPNEPFTSQLVDFLGDRRLCATFFQVGVCVERFPGLTAQMAAAGHVIGNHSYRHRLSTYLVDPGLGSEIRRTQILLQAELGRVPALFRPPWLCHQPPLMAEVSRQGLMMVSGSFAHPLEAAQVPARLIADRVVRRVRPGSIVIFHDGFDARTGDRTQTVRAVRLVVDELTAQGYRFTTVDRLLGLPAYIS